MPESSSYTVVGSPANTDQTDNSLRFVHSISGAGRLLPSSSRWNSIEIDYNLIPQSQANINHDSLPSRFSKSVDFNLTIINKTHFKRFVCITTSVIFSVTLLIVLIHFLPHKHHHYNSSKNLTLALNHALLFFDAQKSGVLPKNNLVKFRGDSGLADGNSSNPPVKLVGGFYDSGNNIKFSFPTAYAITILSWTVIEYHQKYDDIGELDHIKDIIKWGSDYLLNLFISPNDTSSATILYSQVGSAGNDTEIDNDINCWQRPEDMNYSRPVSSCDNKATDIAGEFMAAFSAASLVFKEDKDYSGRLKNSAVKLFDLAIREVPTSSQGTYTANIECGGQAIKFYNSSGYIDEIIWGATWLFLATGNTTYLQYATDNFALAEEEELFSEKGIFDWNNKLTASAVLLTRIRFFRDLGYPYEDAFELSTNRTDSLMCSFLSASSFNKTDGGLILMKPEYGAPLQYAATASFLSKLYSDYLDLLRRSGSDCSSGDAFSLDTLRSFSLSQTNYILGDNPMKMSYVVGFGDHYPTQVHHRGASIPSDGQWHSCAEGQRWLTSNDPNPNVLIGAMVGGPDQNDAFLDQRTIPWFTEPTISSNAGLVAALIALHEPPTRSSESIGLNLGIDMMSMFDNVRPIPPTS